MSQTVGVISLDVGGVSTWSDFHDLFAKELGFPSFFGRNMDAWIDCMTSLDVPPDEMTAIHAPEGGVLTLEIMNAAGLKARDPDIWDALNECTAFVNWRRNRVGEPSVLALSYSM